jgi:membrane protease YdiL (CAAX protease family)
MSNEDMETLMAALPVWVAVSTGLLLLAWGIHAGRIPWARFRAPTMPAEPAFWGGVDLIFIVAIWFVSQVAIGALLGELTLAVGFPSSAALLLAQVGSGLIAFLAIDQRVRVVRGQGLAAVGFRRSPGNVLPTLLLLGVTWIPLATIHVAWNVGLSQVFRYEPEAQDVVNSYQAMVASRDTWSILCFMVGAGTVVPIVEEGLFRGFLYGALRVRTGRVFGAIVTSVVFAILHGSLSAFVPLVVLGCLLVYLYERTGSLYPSILFHAAFNGTTLIRLLFV